MSTKTIPWQRIEERLIGKRDQAWFIREIDVVKNVVSNWKKRGVPMTAAPAIAHAFGISVDELIGLEGSPNKAITNGKPRLSDEALDLILWVVQLDRLGELARKTFVAHKGLLQLSAVASKLHDFPRAHESAEEIARALAARLQATEESPHEQHRT